MKSNFDCASVSHDEALEFMKENDGVRRISV